jgi:hypothetical protein
MGATVAKPAFHVTAKQAFFKRCTTKNVLRRQSLISCTGGRAEQEGSELLAPVSPFMKLSGLLYSTLLI